MPKSGIYLATQNIQKNWTQTWRLTESPKTEDIRSLVGNWCFYRQQFNAQL